MYTSYMKPSFVIVGLGNPGKQYEHTRHNLGFMAVEAAAAESGGGEWKETPKFLCTSTNGMIDGEPVKFVKPTTFMNRSGECIRKLVDFYKLDPAKQLLVLVDEIDIPLGTHRLRMNGGPGTHNGLKSIVETLGENFPRFRIGFGPKPEQIDLAAWVLSGLTNEETKAVETTFKSVIPSVREVLSQ